MQREPIFNIPASVLAVLGLLGAMHVLRNVLPPDMDVSMVLALAFVPARYAGPVPGLPGGDLAALTSPFTYMLVHGDLTHLIINGAWLLAFGGAVAKRIGGQRFLAFSVSCGLASIVVYLALHLGELAPVIGASGAVSGLMAGALRFFLPAVRRGGFALFREHPEAVPLASVGAMFRDPQTLTIIGIWVALNFLFGIGGSSLAGGAAIAWEAHLGGFLFGLFTFGLFDRARSDPAAF